MTTAGPRTILITGASSGLGAALARAYAGADTTLFLAGRDRARLHQIADLCRAARARVDAVAIDVTHQAAMAAWIRECDYARSLDLVIANAGISAGTGQDGESDAQTRAIFATNMEGVVNTVLPAITAMRPRRQGQIALMASLAGFRGLGGAPAYCASKAMVRVWGEGLRADLAPAGINVSVVCPGFVRSPMTAVNDFSMPFLMNADRAARIIRRGLAANRGRIAFPWPMTFAAWAAAALPDRLMDRLSRRLPRKP